MADQMLPLVSVVIPSYNAAAQIEATLLSVINQTWPNIEIIVVDDGSSDNTVAIAGMVNPEKITVISQPNSGACRARNNGFQRSNGKYIQFLDADDLLSRDKIAEQVKALEEYPEHIAVCTTVHFRNGDDPESVPLPDESHFLYSTSDIPEFLARLWGADGLTWMVQTSAWLTPASMIKKAGLWDESILLDQDGEFFARVMLAGKGIRMCRGVNYYRTYVYGSNIASRAHKPKNLQSKLRALNLKCSYVLKHADNTRIRRAMASQYMQVAVEAYPPFPEIFREAWQKCMEQGQPPVVPPLGGRSIELIKSLLGWKTAKWLSYHLHKHLIK
jgi:glycosyltransferase involved in cell wall biosynthesis